MCLHLQTVFVPFLGDFFSIPVKIAEKDGATLCFRPLSRGLFFNDTERNRKSILHKPFSSPFSGTFFQSEYLLYQYESLCWGFSSPFSGTFFQSTKNYTVWVDTNKDVFVPFLGDFFSIGIDRTSLNDILWFVFVPFLGDFFSISSQLT